MSSSPPRIPAGSAPEPGAFGLAPVAFASTLFRLRKRRAGLLASVALHAALLVVVFLALPAPLAHIPPPDSITVELISGGLETAAPPKQAPAPSPAIVAQPSAPRALPATPDNGDKIALPRLPLVHARTILSGVALDRVARESLRTIDRETSFEQLCDIEAMEQIARVDSALKPERALAYATADTRMDGDILIADGAAFLSKGTWHHLAFRCRGSADRRKVLSFDFAAGDPFSSGDPDLPTGADDD